MRSTGRLKEWRHYELQGRNLTERMQGDDVKVLQGEDRQLSFTISLPEIAGKRNGSAQAPRTTLTEI